MEKTDAEIAVTADTRPFEIALERLKELSGGFGSQLTGALRSAAVSGRSLDDILRRVGLNLAGMALDKGLAPLRTVASDMFSNVVGSLGKAFAFANGGIPGRVTAFASGGVVSAPTYFPMQGGMGLMGEAGSEAILPLRRASDGRLGVAATGGGSTVNVTFNVTAPDARSFAKSEAQVTAMLARAVSRGARGL